MVSNNHFFTLVENEDQSTCYPTWWKIQVVSLSLKALIMSVNSMVGEVSEISSPRAAEHISGPSEYWFLTYKV